MVGVIAFFKTPLGWVAGALIALALLAGIYALIFYKGVEHEKDAQAVRAVEAVDLDSKAKGAASTQGVKDQAINNQLTKDLTDAVSALPDAVPSARRVALGCARLRASGRDTSNLPQCR